MEFKKVIEKRRTTRQFTSKPVGRETIEHIIKAGLMAPSFDHARKWNFVILDDTAAKTAAMDAQVHPQKGCHEPIRNQAATPNANAKASNRKA